MMSEKALLTIEIVGLKDGTCVVLDRVIGATASIDEAKRIGQHLFSIVDAEITPTGYRVLRHDDVVFAWQAGQNEEAGEDKSRR
jgi:hypothetical protein